MCSSDLSLRRQTTIGFTPASDEINYERMKDKILEESKKVFRPEFLNRLDEVIVFRSLSKADLIAILDLEVGKVMGRLKNKNIRLELDTKAKDFLTEKGYDPMYGARPMRRAVERYLEDPLAEQVIRGNLTPQSPIQVSVENDKLAFRQKELSPNTISS